MVNRDLVIDFVNTARFDPDREYLETPADLLAWLEERGLDPGGRATKADLEEARAVREALRQLMLGNNDCPCDEEKALDVIDTAACRAHLGVRFGGGGSRIEPRNPGVRGALGKILCEVSESMTEGTWDRMKVCRADDCKYAFYDTAKNKSRAWCSMQSCGNRAKVHAYRERQHA
jgi:predicted RNA-binding Zn ribbon-like protein